MKYSVQMCFVEGEFCIRGSKTKGLGNRHHLQANTGRRNHILWKQGSERSGQVQRTESGNYRKPIRQVPG